MTDDVTSAGPGDAIELETLSYRRGGNGVARIAIDVKGKPVNVLTPALHRELGEVARILADDEQAIGAVVHSAKPTFMAGGDLKRIVGYYDQKRTAQAAYTQSRTYTQSLRRLETCGKPVAVAINGTALGGGLELALACHFRVVADDPDIRLGFPEVGLGLIPGGGGTQRLPRMIGIQKAASMILSGEPFGPEQCLGLGIVDCVAPKEELVDRAEAWVLSRPEPSQPWDSRGFEVPHGAGLNDMRIGALFQRLTASVGAEYRHNYPAPVAVLRCLFEGTAVRSMDQALDVETREFSAITRDPVARNMIRTLFLHKGKTRIRELLEEDRAEELEARCLEAYVGQAALMAEAGVRPALIENGAFAAGLDKGPIALGALSAERFASNRNAADTRVIRDRLMHAQALAAAVCWERGVIERVEADLVSIFGWGFPKYTGGVMSYIDTLGLREFIRSCDELTARHDAGLQPSAWLRARAEASDRVYEPVA